MSQVNANLIQNSAQLLTITDLNNIKVNDDNQLEMRTGFDKALQGVKDFFTKVFGGKDTIELRNANLVYAMKKFVVEEKNSELSKINLSGMYGKFVANANGDDDHRARIARGNELLANAKSMIARLDEQFNQKGALTILFASTTDKSTQIKLENLVTKDIGNNEQALKFGKDEIKDSYLTSTNEQRENVFLGDCDRGAITSFNGIQPANSDKKENYLKLLDTIPPEAQSFVQMCCAQTIGAGPLKIAMNETEVQDPNNPKGTISQKIDPDRFSYEELSNLGFESRSENDPNITLTQDDDKITISYSSTLTYSKAGEEARAPIFQKTLGVKIEIPLPIVMEDGMPKFEVKAYGAK